MREHRGFLAGAAVAALTGALIGLLIVWASGTDGSADAPGAQVTSLTSTPASDAAACAGRDAQARATPAPATSSPSVVLTRGGVRISVPSTFSLAPNVVDARPDPIWFFSSAIDAVDPAIGVRVSLGVYPSAPSFLGVTTNTATSPPGGASSAEAPSATAPAASATTAGGESTRPAATSTAPAGIGDTFLFDAFRASQPQGMAGRCDHGTDSFAGPQRNLTLAFSDTAAGHVEFHQRSMVLLADGRIVVLAVDGIPDVVPWSTERALFTSALRSIALGN